MRRRDPSMQVRAAAAPLQRVAAWVHAWESVLVRQQVQLARKPGIRAVALAVNHLGNGWLYPLIAAALFWTAPVGAVGVLMRSVAAVAAAHLVYPWIKRVVARPRPCELEPDLPPLLRVLDRHSFPSGHCMTATAAAVPICAMHPGLTVVATCGCVLMAWARVAAAHHYPSDTLAGVVLGATMAAPIALLWT